MTYMGAPLPPRPRKPTPAELKAMASRKDYYPYKVKYKQLYRYEGGGLALVNKWEYRMPDGRTLQSGPIPAEDFAHLTVERLKGNLPGECYATFSVIPPSPNWRNLRWWRSKWWGVYGMWKRGEFPRPGLCEHCNRPCVKHYTPSMRMDDATPGYFCRSCYWEHNPTDGSLGCVQSRMR